MKFTLLFLGAIAMTVSAGHLDLNQGLEVSEENDASRV